MPGNTYADYRERRKVTGRLKLDNQIHEDTLQFLAEGYGKPEVVEMLGDKISSDEIDALLATPLGQRRYQFVQQAKARAEYQPQTPDECLAFSKRILVENAKAAKMERNRILAAKQLAEIAIEERDHNPTRPPAPSSNNTSLNELSHAFKEKGEGAE